MKKKLTDVDRFFKKKYDDSYSTVFATFSTRNIIIHNQSMSDRRSFFRDRIGIGDRLLVKRSLRDRRSQNQISGSQKRDLFSDRSLWLKI